MADYRNEARWAACNTRWDIDAVPSMEKAGEVADAVYDRVVADVVSALRTRYDREIERLQGDGAADFIEREFAGAALGDKRGPDA